MSKSAAMVPTHLIDAHHTNVRHDLGDLRPLIASIERHGLMVPVIVERRGDRYRLRDGHRRWPQHSQSASHASPRSSTATPSTPTSGSRRPSRSTSSAANSPATSAAMASCGSASSAGRGRASPTPTG